MRPGSNRMKHRESPSRQLLVPCARERDTCPWDCLHRFMERGGFAVAYHLLTVLHSTVQNVCCRSRHATEDGIMCMGEEEELCRAGWATAGAKTTAAVPGKLRKRQLRLGCPASCPLQLCTADSDAGTCWQLPAAASKLSPLIKMQKLQPKQLDEC